MKIESTRVISRIVWCRIQHQLYSVTREERAGWKAEEAGLVDALRGRDRTAVMRKEFRSQFMRYQCGLEDGQALLRLGTSIPSGMTGAGGGSPTPLTTQAGVASRPSRAPRSVHVESRR